MNIHDTATKFKISVSALRRLEKGGLLTFEKPSDSVAKMRFLLIRRQQLPVDSLLELLDDPGTLFDLYKYEERGRAQITALGDVRSSMAPIEVLAAISDAAGGDAVAAQVIASWLMRILPATDVSHHWVAVRLLLPLDPVQRGALASKVSFALMHMRKLESFAGYWASVENKSGRKEIKYFQKRVANLDL